MAAGRLGNRDLTRHHGQHDLQPRLDRPGHVAERCGGDRALGRGHQRGRLRGKVGGEDLPEQRRVDRELDRGLPVRSGRKLVPDLCRVQDAVLGLARDLA
jgi:hypothetical protein